MRKHVTIAALAESAEQPKAKRHRVRAVSLGAVAEVVDLDRALALADSLEDEAIVQKLGNAVSD